jgi:serine/threonine protein kinase
MVVVSSSSSSANVRKRRRNVVCSTGRGGVDPNNDRESSSLSTGPPALQRRQTMSGNIIVVTPPEGGQLAYWLQRKIGQNSHGIVRLGYKLRLSTSKDSFEESSNFWELETDEMGRQTLVAVTIMDRSILDEQQQSLSSSSNKEGDPIVAETDKSGFLQAAKSPLDEISALQMIARHNSTETAHVVGTNVVATCSQSIYTILKYHRDGTLLQFCQTVGCLEEPLARYLFRQILQVSSHVQMISWSGECCRCWSIGESMLRVHTV